jgi:N-acetylmuramoyl-L-alanine amidase
LSLPPQIEFVHPPIHPSGRRFFRSRRLLTLLVLLAATVALPAQAPGRKVIVLDPGHGGDDAGVKSPGGAFEKDAALLFAGSLRRILREDPAVDVVLTREDDRRLSLEDRSVIANRSRPTLFLSLHCAFGRGGAAGFVVYYFQPSPEQAERFHIIERDVDGRDVRLVPWDLAQFSWSPASKEMANILQRRINAFEQAGGGVAVSYPLEQLATVNCPAVLLEFIYLNNPDQAQRINDPAWRDAYARTVRDALQEFIRAGQSVLAGN